MLNPTPDAGIESIFEMTSQMDVQTPTSVAPLPMSAPTLTPSTIATITKTEQAPTPPTTAPSTLLQDLPNFGSLFGFDHRLKTLEANFSEFMQTNQFGGAVSSIPRITIDENMQKIIKEWVKEQVKVQVSKSLPKIDQTVNEQLEAEVLTRSSNSSKTSYAVAADLSEMELKKIHWVNPEGQQYPHNMLKPLPQIPNSRGRRVIPFDHFINNDLEYLSGDASSHKYTTFVTKTKAADYGHIKWIEDLVPRTMWIQEPHRIVSITELKIVEWHNYKHLDWITVRQDDDKLYKFKEGDFKRLRIQDIEDMLLLLVQGKRMEDLQLGVESYQKKLNLTRLDTYRSDLNHKEAYIAYSNPRGFIYQNKDKQNMLMQIDELHKFSDGTLIDVRTALDDRLKGIRMKYLLQTIWRKNKKDRAAAMIQAIDKMLKTRRIIRSLERFVRGRLYEGDFRMLQRTI
nr:hypothetical protein [Tanacetum cinerariifolium]